MNKKPTKPKRKLRNFLLDKRFQLKYTFSAMLVSSFISVGLGIFLYQAYDDMFEAHQEVYEAHRENSQMLSLDPDLDQALAKELQAKDEKIRLRNDQLKVKSHMVMIYLAFFLVCLVICLGAISIVATHKIAGPAFALRRALSELASGKLSVRCKLRQGDELQQIAEELQNLISWFRKEETEDVEKLKTLCDQLQHNPEMDNILKAIHQWIEEKQARLS